MTKQELIDIIKEEIEIILLERCQKGYKTHPKRKTKKMYGKTYRNCIKAEESNEQESDEVLGEKKSKRDGKGSGSKDYSLKDWFRGGGWVQTGGKYDGKTLRKTAWTKIKTILQRS